jgi:hypothetical protein
MTRKNPEIRKAIKEASLLYWQVAERYGLSDGNFSRLLRQELPPESQQAILQIIQELKKS